MPSPASEAQDLETPADSDLSAAGSRPEPASGATAPAASAAPSVANASEFAPVVKLLSDHSGLLTPEVRAAYVAAAKHTVLRLLQEAKQTIPPDCLDEVQADPTLSDAMFAVVDPPDPSILQHYAGFRAQLGPGFMHRYGALVVAAAVENRTKGVWSPDVPVVASSKALGKDDLAKEQAANLIADYLRGHQLSALNLYHDADQQTALVTQAKATHATDAVLREIQNHRDFGGLLKQAMIRLGQRPASRQPRPDAVTWMRHLASIYEARPASLPADKHGQPAPWPRFPMDRAPWPLLLPLAQTFPLEEAGYIWEKYQGQHGRDYYHTYGPYRVGEGVLLAELQPSPWHWHAWPDLIVHGGVCTVMGPIARQTHVCLCEPAVEAGQPGHSNLLTYRCQDGQWYGVVEQAFAGGTDRTMAKWLFQDSSLSPGINVHRNFADAEYLLGVALGMDLGVRAYVDTRIAVALYGQLSDEQQRTLGPTLLRQATQTNPFNPAPWYLLARQTTTPTQGMELAHQVLRAAHGAITSTDNPEEDDDDTSPTEQALATYVETTHPKPVAHALDDYWKTVAEWIVKHAVLNRPVPTDLAEAHGIDDFLKTTPRITTLQTMAYRVHFDGGKAVADELTAKVQRYLAHPTQKEKDRKRFVAELSAFLKNVDHTAGEDLRTSLESLFARNRPDDDFYLPAIQVAR